MLVVNRHALETVDFLHLGDEEIVERGRPEDLEDLVRIGGTFGKCWPLCTTSPGCTMMCLPVAIRCSSSCCGLLVFHDELALAADGAFERHDAVDAGHFGGFLRTTSFEELGDAGKTTGDVLGLGRLTRRLGEQAHRER